MRRDIYATYVGTVAAVVCKWCLSKYHAGKEGIGNWALYCKLYCN
jgi:hypothetical protein